MSNQGVRGFYQILETIKDNLLDNVDINTVTTGSLSDINLRKQDIFPLAHILVNNAIIEEQIIRFNITVFTMDIVNQSKEQTVDIFTGNNNVQNILNTQLAVLNKLISILQRGNLYTSQYQLDTNPICEPFYDRFDNELAGWSATMDIIINNDINIC